MPKNGFTPFTIKLLETKLLANSINSVNIVDDQIQRDFERIVFLKQFTGINRLFY